MDQHVNSSKTGEKLSDSRYILKGKLTIFVIGFNIKWEGEAKSKMIMNYTDWATTRLPFAKMQNTMGRGRWQVRRLQEKNQERKMY